MGAEHFFLAGDFNLELEMLKKEEEESNGPCCWRV